MASPVVEAIVSKIVDLCGPSLIKHTRYVISPKRYIDELEDALKELDAAETRLQHRIDNAKNSGYGIEKDVWEWRKEVRKLRESTSELTTRSRRTTVDYFNGVVKIPRPVERHRLAKQAVEGKLKVVEYCTKEKQELAEVAYRIHHHVGGTSAIKSVFIDIDTHTRLIKKVFKVLEGGSDDAGCIIGIHGIRGVGKSTLVRTIAARARESGRYDKVDIIMVSTTPDGNNLHASIVNFMAEAEVTEDKAKKNQKEQKPNDKKVADEKTGGDKNAVEQKEADQKDNEDQAKENTLLDRKAANKGDNTKTEDDDHPAPGNKKVLIIIDDLSEKIDLDTHIDNGMRKNLKVQFLVTSKTPELLSSINCQPILALNALSNPEARELLTRLVGPDKAAKLGNITDDELGKRCAGLPVFIEALAQIIKRSNSANLWEDALNELPHNLDSVDTILEVTYKQLDDQVKFLFSLCAVLGGQTFHVQHLFRDEQQSGRADEV